MSTADTPARAARSRAGGSGRPWLSQRRVCPARAELAGLGTLDREHPLGLVVGLDAQAGAAVPVAADVRAHPLALLEGRPGPVGLVAALHADGPFAVAVVQPHVAGRGVLEPPAAGLFVHRGGTRGALAAAGEGRGREGGEHAGDERANDG